MVDITLSKIVSYAFGIPATLCGLLLLLVGALISTGLLVAGLTLTLAGLISLPLVRSLLKDRADVKISTPAVAGIAIVLVAVSSGALVVGILGLGEETSSDGYTGSGSDVSNVTVKANDADPDQTTHELDVTWNARAQSAVDPDPDDMSIYNAEDGQKFLVVRMQLTNAGEESIELTDRLFRVVVDGVEYESQSLMGSSQGGLSQVTLQPDATYDGWVVFSVPEGATSAELIVYQDAYYNANVAVEFTQDESMAINVSD